MPISCVTHVKCKLSDSVQIDRYRLPGHAFTQHFRFENSIAIDENLKNHTTMTPHSFLVTIDTNNPRKSLTRHRQRDDHTAGGMAEQAMRILLLAELKRFS